jgi:hypothetical protein
MGPTVTGTVPDFNTGTETVPVDTQHPWRCAGMWAAGASGLMQTE